MFYILGISVFARIDTKFYRGIQIKYNEDKIAVYFEEPSPRFLQFYNKQNINQVVPNNPANVSQLGPMMRVLIESKPGMAVLGTVIGKYLNDSDKYKSNNSNEKYRKDNSSYSNSIDDLLFVNLTVRLDESGKDVSLVNKTVWLLPVQVEDKGWYISNDIKTKLSC